MKKKELSIDDLRLINALQVRPRASWLLLGRSLGADPVTLSRRWERLREQGIAWIAAYYSVMRRPSAALLEIECPPASTLDIARQLARDPEVLSIDLTTGQRVLLVTVMCDSVDQLSGYVLERMGSLPGITTLRTQMITTAFVDARNWRLRVLTPSEVDVLSEGQEPPHGVANASLEEEAALYRALYREPRITMKSLAIELDVTQGRARALLHGELSSGNLVLRTEIARPYSGWPVYAWFFLRVPPEHRAEAAQQLTLLRESRLVASILGRYDIVLAVWLKSITDLDRFEVYLSTAFPSVTVLDRSIVLRTPFHLRRNLDAHGRHFSDAND
ncbi:Lrp/AsnC family transcriptional regulator [Lysinibacter sp. HNR]|uniref:Lrp/AsnC family transcriptional regulator n=1 Tax=Lysinibacter sp. HNR TaxID=3031408 RepID=UPI002434F8B6|nr:Lrp/AsnC family transcriptional regulator [Lysinibacter sp. HNR]WGD37069.1 Lrp/AsnC family transcriptional regulator [Lysinibacter sp. HNR]